MNIDLRIARSRIAGVVRAEVGQAATEYTLMVALVAFGATAGYHGVANSLTDGFNHIRVSFADAFGTGSGGGGNPGGASPASSPASGGDSGKGGNRGNAGNSAGNDGHRNGLKRGHRHGH